jgi:hypothetical protein
MLGCVGFEIFRAFEQDAEDFAGFARTKLTMPMLVLAGEKASGEFLVAQGRLVDTAPSSRMPRTSQASPGPS